MPDNRPHQDPYDDSSWTAPDPFFVSDTDIRDGTAESISSDFIPTITGKKSIIPILIIGFLLYKYL